MRHTLLTLAALLLLFTPTLFAQADETVADLRRENDQLRERVAQLEATLATQIELNEELVKELRELRTLVLELRQQMDLTREAVDAQNDQQPPAPAIEVPRLADDPSDPMASPGLLLNALRRDHQDRFLDPEIEDPEARKRYIAELRRWFRAVERDFAKRVEWQIQPVSVERLDRDRLRMIFRVVDPESGLPYDTQPASMIVDGRDASRVLANPDATRWRFLGVFGAAPRLNTEREEMGLVDTPPFVGVYVEYAYTIKVTSLYPLEDD